jgi:TRAP transporter TAXI family solute receptor
MKNRSGKTILGLIVGLLSLIPLSAWAETALSFGTSSIGSSNYIITAGMANLLTKQTGINISAEAVGGSDANVRGLKDKKIDLAMLNSLSVVNAHLGNGPFAKTGKIPLAVLVQGQERYSFLVVRKASGVRTPADLAGKKFIGKRRAMADVEMVTNAMLKAYGVPKESVKILETAETNEAIEALKTGAADGALIPGGQRASNLLDLAGAVDMVFLSIPDDKYQVMLQDLGPAFLSGTIPAGVYKGQDQPVHLPMLLLCVSVRPDFPEDTAYKITKTLMENQEALKAIHNVGKEWTLANTLRPPPAPFHPGAVKYFKEKGVWTSSQEAAQQALLKQAAK